MACPNCGNSPSLRGNFCPLCGADCANKPEAGSEEDSRAAHGSAMTFSQADVDKIVARAKELGASAGLTYKQGHLRLSSYSEPHGAEALAMLIVNGWHGKYDLIYATQALVEFLSPNAKLTDAGVEP